MLEKAKKSQPALINQLAVQSSYFLNIIFQFSLTVTEYSRDLLKHKLYIRAYWDSKNLYNTAFRFNIQRYILSGTNLCNFTKTSLNMY